MENSLLKKRIAEHISLANEIIRDERLLSQVQEVSRRISSSLKEGGKIIFMGNGGSAADAQHMAAEFVGRYAKERQALPAIALTTNSSTVTAIGNDYGFEKIFLRQLQAFAQKGDIVVGLSTSGNSPNVVEALSFAKSRGIFCVAFVGSKPCKLDRIANICIKVPSESTPRIQEMHELLLHIICEEVESSF
ncbi:MAG: D-sedoheptulose 7-phosphate isomerase [Candidatus Micrarchaeota archaeon]|nr:D-sedoheptulose 7-phosphate isomerase [Candidatus Micrarchaeota archaeon]